jgi:VanZ family protein
MVAHVASEVTFDEAVKVQEGIELDPRVTGIPGQENNYPECGGTVRLIHRDAGGRLNARRWLPPVLWAGVIIFATSTPSDLVPQQVSTFDKAAHFTMYAVLAALLTRELAGMTGPWRAALLALTIGIGFGAIDEWHQQYIPGRSTELADWYADSLGAATGALLFAAFARMRTSTHTA